MTIYDNIINSSQDRLVKQIIQDRTKSTKPPEKFLRKSKGNSRSKYKIRKSNNSKEIRLGKNSQR